jgi:hypothetical protein
MLTKADDLNTGNKLASNEKNGTSVVIKRKLHRDSQDSEQETESTDDENDSSSSSQESALSEQSEEHDQEKENQQVNAVNTNIESGSLANKTKRLKESNGNVCNSAAVSVCNPASTDPNLVTSNPTTITEPQTTTNTTTAETSKSF